MNDNAKNKILFESIELNIIIIIKNYLVITEKLLIINEVKEFIKKIMIHDIIFILVLWTLYWYNYNPMNKWLLLIIKYMSD